MKGDASRIVRIARAFVTAPEERIGGAAAEMFAAA
jgi:hypothetical protein